MNVYEKLCEARVALQNKNLKESGNQNGKLYYELSDFLPHVTEICASIRLLPVVTFPADKAIMKVIDIDKPEDYLEFESPFGSAELRGCHVVQNIGAVETYQRRYLYMTAFEIVESDILDSSLESQKPKSSPEMAEILCPECGKPVHPVKKNGKVVEPEEVLKKLGKCAECYKLEQEILKEETARERDNSRKD